MQLKPFIGFVTDGRLSQLVGIAAIIRSFFLTSHINKFSLPIYIATSMDIIVNVEEFFFKLFGNLNICFVKATKRRDDIYYVQMGLSNILELLLPSDLFIALDYDHLILNSNLFPNFANLTDVLVSSEISSDVRKHIVLEREFPDGVCSLPNKHINLSFVYGKVGQLQQIAKYWQEAYSTLYNYISVRYRVELAFALAAEQANVILIPCEISLQGNFFLPSRNCWIFHYGGEYKQSNILKNLLTSGSAQLKDITLSQIDEIVRVLTNTLLTFI